MVQRKRRPRPPTDGGNSTAAIEGQNASSSTNNPAGTPSKPANTSLAALLTLAQARPTRDTTYTTAGVAGVLYGELITWALREVAIKYRHRTTVSRSRAKLVPPVPTGHSTASPSQHPDLHYSDKNVHATCSNCAATVSASRYAQHLEKCLGRGGRSSSRAASARLKASAERAEREDSEDAAAVTTTFGNRRRRTAQHDSETGQKGGTKRRRPSPAPVNMTGALPPSGRNRLLN